MTIVIVIPYNKDDTDKNQKYKNQQYYNDTVDDSKINCNYNFNDNDNDNRNSEANNDADNFNMNERRWHVFIEHIHDSNILDKPKYNKFNVIVI